MIRSRISLESVLTAGCAAALLAIQIAIAAHTRPEPPRAAAKVIEVGIVEKFSDFYVCRVCWQLGAQTVR